MRLLLDTRVVIWLGEDPSRLSSNVLSILRRRTEPPLISAASVWEMAIKLGLGKLSISVPLEDYIEVKMRRSGAVILPIEMRHLYRTERLPLHHRDLFDRLIVSQGLTDDLAIVSADPQLDVYGVTRIW